MYNILPFILTLAALIAIIVIVVRKFSVLATLDIESIPAEKEAKFKEKIIGQRIKRNTYKYYSVVLKILRPLGEGIAKGAKWIYIKLIEFKENYNKEKEVVNDDPDTIDKLMAGVDDCMKAGDYDTAEKSLIDVIGRDATLIKAFLRLGDVYFEKKQLAEAKQTYFHALKLMQKDRDQTEMGKDGEDRSEKIGLLDSQIAETFFNIVGINKAEENLDEATKNLKSALKIQANNPRFLDMMLQISIMNKDKVTALEAYGKLRETNPENQKLSEYKEQIGEL